MSTFFNGNGKKPQGKRNAVTHDKVIRQARDEYIKERTARTGLSASAALQEFSRAVNLEKRVAQGNKRSFTQHQARRQEYSMERLESRSLSSFSEIQAYLKATGNTSERQELTQQLSAFPTEIRKQYEADLKRQEQKERDRKKRAERNKRKAAEIKAKYSQPPQDKKTGNPNNKNHQGSPFEKD